MFINDDFKTVAPAANPALWKPTYISNGVSVGSNASVLPVNICSNVVIMAGAVVTKNIIHPGFYAVNPAKKLR